MKSLLILISVISLSFAQTIDLNQAKSKKVWSQLLMASYHIDQLRETYPEIAKFETPSFTSRNSTGVTAFSAAGVTLTYFVNFAFDVGSYDIKKFFLKEGGFLSAGAISSAAGASIYVGIDMFSKTDEEKRKKSFDNGIEEFAKKYTKFASNFFSLTEGQKNQLEGSIIKKVNTNVLNDEQVEVNLPKLMRELGIIDSSEEVAFTKILTDLSCNTQTEDNGRKEIEVSDLSKIIEYLGQLEESDDLNTATKDRLGKLINKLTLEVMLAE